MGYNEIERKVSIFIMKNNLMHDDIETIYVATSGGADSMALLAYMNTYSCVYNIVAVHVNHGIRDITADRDEQFVKDYCEKNNIKYIIFNAKKDGVEIPENPSEDWARELRYGYFSTLIPEGCKNAKIATAHTMSDQAETVLFRMARGCGLNGLTGIPVMRENIIRPFLCLTRAEIEELVEYYGTSNITDESNLTDDYARNKIRHHVIPVMKDINPNAEMAMQKTCERIASAYEYIHSIAQKELDRCVGEPGVWYNVEGFYNQPDVILDDMILTILGYYNAANETYLNLVKNALLRYDEDADYSNEVMKNRIDIGEGRYVIVTSRYLSVKMPIEEKPLVLGKNILGKWGHGIVITEINQETFQKMCTSKHQLAFFADADKLDLESLTMTSKRYGDKFKPACRYKNKLVNYLSGYGIHEREEAPVIRDGEGNIVYFHSIGFTDGYTPTSESTKIYSFIPF